MLDKTEPRKYLAYPVLSKREEEIYLETIRDIYEEAKDERKRH